MGFCSRTALMPKIVLRSFLVAGCALVVSVCFTKTSFAQSNLFQLNGAAAQDDEEVVTLTAKVVPASEGKPARLSITAQIAKGFHISSITQPPGGPVRTLIKLDPSEQYKVAGD